MVTLRCTPWRNADNGNERPDRQNSPASGDLIGVVYSTFDVSLGPLEKYETARSQHAAGPLEVMAFFHFEVIPFDLFTRMVENRDNVPTFTSSASWASSFANGLPRHLEPPAPLPGFPEAKDREVGK